MKKLFILFCFLFSFATNAQTEQLAFNYFDRGEFDKAITLLEEIVVKQPGNYTYFQKMIECYQQLKQYEKAETAILYKIKISKMPNSYVELGYNYQLQKNEDKATDNYNLAIEQVVLNSNYAYSVAAE